MTTLSRCSRFHIHFSILSLLLSFACSDSRTQADVTPEPDLATDLASDLTAADGSDVAGPECPVEQGILLPADSGTTRFALSLFHYNVQYCAGGLEGMFDEPELELNDAQVQDLIIVESLVPLLDALLAHPTWGVDIEMQGYMLDIMAERHLAELEKMRELVVLGQVHVDSFHYADQLWTGHPLPSMERSWEFNERAFARACIPLGGAVFSQEGQFGQGMVRRLAGSGRVALFPTNLQKYHHGSGPVNLMYEWDQTPVVIAGRGALETVGGKELEVKWHFMNDGELAFTGNLNPYFGTFFKYDDKESKKYIAKLEQLEADGWRIATIADFKAHLDLYGYQPDALEPALDGTWQPGDTGNHYLWMGQSGVFGDTEDDNGVLTGLTRSRMMLQGAQALMEAMGEQLKGAAGLEELIEQAWRHQLLGEVSDSTGWNPWQGEVLYSKDHSAQASGTAGGVVSEVLEQSGEQRLAVDTATSQLLDESSLESVPVTYLVTTGGEELSFVPKLSLDGLLDEEEAPLEVAVEAPGWEVTLEWWRLDKKDCYWVSIMLAATETAGRDVVITFPRFSDTLAYVPALLENDGEVSQFDVAGLHLDDTDTLGLGLANGLLGIGDGKWLLKPTSLVHLAAMIPKSEYLVRFENHSQPQGETAVLGFFYLADESPAEAVSFASLVNAYPVMEFQSQQQGK